MKQKIYFTHLFYFIGGFIVILMPIILNLLMVYMIIFVQDNPSIKYAYFILSIGLIGFALILIIIGKKMFQWIIIDETKITAKCIFGKIKSIEWKDLKVIAFERFDISIVGYKSGWFVFVETGKELCQRNGIITKNSYITLKYNKSTLKTIKYYWRKEIINT